MGTKCGKGETATHRHLVSALTAGAFFVAVLLKWESFISGSGIPR